MIVALSGKAFDLSLEEGRLSDPALWSDALKAWSTATPGGGTSLRAKLVLFGLAAAEMRDVTSVFAAQVDYAVPALGSRLFLVLERSGVDPRAACGAFLEALKAAQAAVAEPVAAPAPVARPEAPLQDDPYPGLTRGGETWAEFNRRTNADTSMAVQNIREEWRAAGTAWEEKRIGDWMAQVGTRLGFVLGSAPGEG